jgi:integrase
MIMLPDGRKASIPTILPKDYASPSSVDAIMKVEWMVYYRVYPHPNEPVLLDKNGKKKGIPAKRILGDINTFKKYRDRVQAAEALRKFTEEGLRNPAMMDELFELEGDITPRTPLEKALNISHEKHMTKYRQEVQDGIKYVMERFIKACKRMGIANMEVGHVKRKHVILVLKNEEEDSKRAGSGKVWSNNVFNNQVRYLRMLFKPIAKMEAVDSNPLNDIEKLPVVRKIPILLEPQERVDVATQLKKNFPDFDRFIQIFFHSGGRTTEMMALKVKDVNLKKQEYKCIVYKNGTGDHLEVLRPIKDIAVELWRQQIKGANPEWYVFGKGLKPNPEPINRKQISRRWRKHVKNKLGIQADFYKLKHLNTTEIADQLSAEDAMKQMGHKTVKMTNGVYDTRYKVRKDDKLKSMNNSFVPSIESPKKRGRPRKAS